VTRHRTRSWRSTCAGSPDGPVSSRDRSMQGPS